MRTPGSGVVWPCGRTAEAVKNSCHYWALALPNDRLKSSLNTSVCPSSRLNCRANTWASPPNFSALSMAATKGANCSIIRPRACSMSEHICCSTARARWCSVAMSRRFLLIHSLGSRSCSRTRAGMSRRTRRPSRSQRRRKYEDHSPLTIASVMRLYPARSLPPSPAAWRLCHMASHSSGKPKLLRTSAGICRSTLLGLRAKRPHTRGSSAPPWTARSMRR